MQTFVEWLEDLIGARGGQQLDGTTPAGPPASVRALVDDAYRRIADALLSHLLDAELDRSNSEEKGQRHAHVFIAGTLRRRCVCVCVCVCVCGGGDALAARRRPS